MDHAPRLRRLFLSAVTLGVLGASAGDAVAGGFNIHEQSARSLGTAYVGEAAAAEDATTLFFNPAGATLLEGSQVALSGALIRITGDFDENGSTRNPLVGGGRLHGERDADGGELGFVGAGYLSHALSDRWRIGLAVTSPWGLAVGYDRPWVGRYHALVSDLKTIDVAPTVAVKLLDQLSFGVGLDVQYAYVKLTNMLDTGSICQLNAPQLGLPTAACDAVGLTPQAADGFLRIRGDSWGLGYNLGLLWHPTPRTRVGLSYRSTVDHDFDTEVTFRLPPQARVLREMSGALVSGAADAELDMPEVVRLGLYHELTPRWAVQLGVDWTHWSRFEQLTLEFDNPRQPTLTEEQRWHDTWRTGLGVLYRPFERWRFRAGFAYDPTPVPNAVRRSPRIPDHDRYWASGGVGFAATERLLLHFGYAHVFSEAAQSKSRESSTGHVLRGRWQGNADIFSAQVTWRFL